MFIKIYNYYYNLDQVYKLYIWDVQQDKETGIYYQTMTLYFTASIENNGNRLDSLSISSLKDDEAFIKTRDYLLKNVIYSQKWN